MGTVLVVDDNLDICRVISAFLQRGGHRAICVTRAADAMLKLLEGEQPPIDLVITDLMMPEQSGLDLLGAIRAAKRTTDLPVIVYSAVSERRYVEQAMRAGATDYWLKGSIQPHELQTRIAAFLPDGSGWSVPLRHDPVHAL